MICLPNLVKSSKHSHTWHVRSTALAVSALDRTSWTTTSNFVRCESFARRADDGRDRPRFWSVPCRPVLASGDHVRFSSLYGQHTHSATCFACSSHRRTCLTGDDGTAPMQTQRTSSRPGVHRSVPRFVIWVLVWSFPMTGIFWVFFLVYLLFCSGLLAVFRMVIKKTPSFWSKNTWAMPLETQLA